MQNNINNENKSTSYEVLQNNNKEIIVMDPSGISMFKFEDEEIKAHLLINKFIEIEKINAGNETAPRIEYNEDAISLYDFKRILDILKLMNKTKRIKDIEISVKRNAPLTLKFKDEYKKVILEYYLAPRIEY